MIHEPHVETYDLAAGTNIDRWGTPRPLEHWHRTEFGLYVARPVVDHSRIAFLRAWLLPDLDLRITDFSAHEGKTRFEDYYVDVVDVTVDGTSWRTVDHYLDILVRTGEDTTVVDTDEFLAAVQAGFLDLTTAERALETTYSAFAGITASGHDVNTWLRSVGITLSWPPPERDQPRPDSG